MIVPRSSIDGRYQVKRDILGFAPIVRRQRHSQVGAYGVEFALGRGTQELKYLALGIMKPAGLQVRPQDVDLFQQLCAGTV